MALEQSQNHCNRCGKPTLHQRVTSGPPHVGCLLILLTSIALSFLLPIISWIITVPVILTTLAVWLVWALVAAFSQPPFRCSQCGQAAGELTPEQKAATVGSRELATRKRVLERELEEARMAPLRAERACARAAKAQLVRAKFFSKLARVAETVVSHTNRLLLKMAGGEENIILYRFLQVVVVSIPFVLIAIAMAISSSNRQAAQARIEAANQEVRQAVEEADKWIQSGRLADADRIEGGLKTAETNAVATQKTAIGPTLTAFTKAKGERQAAGILESALRAIAKKQLDQAQTFLREYLEHPYATEQQKAKELLAEIAWATSDEDALRTLVAMEDKAFASLRAGDRSTVVHSHPVLAETRLGTLSRNLPEASRQREEKRKKAEAERLAEQKPIEAEREAAQKGGVGGKVEDFTKELTVDLGGVKLEVVLIPAGDFMMGSPESDKRAFDIEQPQHKVRITKPYYMGKYLVTQEQWQAVMGDNPSMFTGPKNPVERVSWDDCQAFLVKLNERPGKGRFQLPTEAQWEYACRAGSTTRYFFGDDESVLGEYAWYGANSRDKAHPVGEKKSNPWGLYDVYGNVGEWCQDWYDENYYAGSPMDDPTGPTTGSDRVKRGGSWGTKVAAGYRSAFRNGDSPEARRRRGPAALPNSVGGKGGISSAHAVGRQAAGWDFG